MRIPIAEDDQVLADGLMRTLRASGAAVDQVSSGSQADAALLTNNAFDLLILDLWLPHARPGSAAKTARARLDAGELKRSLKQIGRSSIRARTA